MRCRICDWSPNSPKTFFNEGLVTGPKPNNPVYDTESGTYNCSFCAPDSRSWDKETQEFDLEHGSPEVELLEEEFDESY